MSRILREGVIAGSVGAVVGGVPSTAHAMATGRDPLEATLAAGTILLREERRPSRLLPAAALAHGSISLFWGVVLAAVLPRRRPVLAGSLAGLAIAVLDLGLIGRRIPRIRSLPPVPQVADHVTFGAAVGAVLALGEAELSAERPIQASPTAVFEFLSDLRNHWTLEDCFAELGSLQGGTGSRPGGGTVRLTGPLGISRTARTQVVSASPPTDRESGQLSGRADLGRRTHGRVSWLVQPDHEDRSRVVLSATLDQASPLDWALFILGRPWLRRTFRRVLDNLAVAVGGRNR